MYTVKKTFKSGELIVRENTLGSSAFIIDKGKVEVSKRIGNQRIVLSQLEKGSIFGEICLVDDFPRSATVTALEDTTVTIISKNAFNQLLNANPALATIFRVLACRLRQTDVLINPLKLSNLYYSLCSLVYYLAKAEGETNEDELILDYDKLVNECCTILALEKDLVEKVIHRLIFTRLVNFVKKPEGEEKELIIPNSDLFKEFINFLRIQSAESLDQVKTDVQALPDNTYQILKTLVEKTEEFKPRVEKISVQYERCLEIVENLLNFSKEETDKLFQPLINNGIFKLIINQTTNTRQIVCNHPERLSQEIEKQEGLKKFQKMVDLLKALAEY
jgi:hypothetical protein